MPWFKNPEGEAIRLRHLAKAIWIYGAPDKEKWCGVEFSIPFGLTDDEGIAFIEAKLCEIESAHPERSAAVQRAGFEPNYSELFHLKGKPFEILRAVDVEKEYDSDPGTGPFILIRIEGEELLADPDEIYSDDMKEVA